MSGKEATVYVVQVGHETRCAKVYKEATERFRLARDYTESRKVKNTRLARAMARGASLAGTRKKLLGKAPRSMRYAT